LAGGDDAAVVVLTTASKKPESSGEEYRELFLELGWKDAGISVCGGRSSEHDEHNPVE
jgi:hypothetical protein